MTWEAAENLRCPWCPATVEIDEGRDDYYLGALHRCTGQWRGHTSATRHYFYLTEAEAPSRVRHTGPPSELELLLKDLDRAEMDSLREQLARGSVLLDALQKEGIEASASVRIPLIRREQ